MRKYLLLIVYCFISIFSFGQVSSNSQWAWMKGDSALPQFAVYGSKGVASINNYPGGREFSVSWKDASGNFWLFGGQGNDGSYFSGLDDLWKYNTSTNQWSWMKGDSVGNGKTVYGVKGTPSLNNNPGPRTQSMSWTDASENLWLYGGHGNDVDGVLTDLNDLWKYDPTINQWTWMKGDSTGGIAPVFGTQGTADPNNKPGGRLAGVSWTDVSGNLWLFGGYGLSSSGYGRLSDLWKFDPASNQWTWMKGYSAANTYGVYGTQGTADPANLPGARYSCVSWLDGSGKFWLFGGISNTGVGGFNDLWQYDPSTNNWTWMKGDNTTNLFAVYGTKGTPAAANKPGSKAYSLTWTDTSGKLWLFGGNGFTATTSGDMNDLWKYDPSTNQWTWINGDSTINMNGVYGMQGAASSTNKPGARKYTVSWTDVSGNLWLFGGSGYTAQSYSSSMNDLWKYNPSTNQWTYIKGDSSAELPIVYGTQGISASTNKPSQRTLSISWTDNSGNFWLLGGYGYDAKGNLDFLNDFWEYNPSTNQWAWMKGDTLIDVHGVYGTKGSPSAANKPGGRAYSISWKDNSGNLWLFGGFGYANTTTGNLNDLWEYNTSTNMWAWISGDSTAELPGIYGNLGVAASTNKPGGRQSSVSITDAAGNLWLFGGRGRAAKAGGFGGYLNDFWKYNISSNQWTWIKGDSSLNVPGIYGAIGATDVNNKPGARQNPVTWTDNAGNLWLFGGAGYAANASGYGGELNDLWKYNISTNEWTWIKGDSILNVTGIYGTQGTSAAGNNPGARYLSISWKDNSGNLILFGGNDVAAITSGYMNDLWKYDPALNQWTWLKGDSIVNVKGVYGAQGSGSATNNPGSRTGMVSWKDNSGNLWLYGGNGYSALGSGYLNDLWELKVNAALPVTWLNFNGALRNNETYLSWSTANEFNSKGFEIQKSLDGQTFAGIGFVEGAGNSSIINNYSFTDTKVQSGTNYYRLKQIDLDGRFSYSSVIKIEYSNFKWAILGNPVTNNSWVQLQLDKTANVSLQIISINGAIIKTINKGIIAAGAYSIQLNLPGTTTNMYIVRLVVNGEIFSKKIIK